MRRANPAAELPSLTALRGLAALVVLAFHCVMDCELPVGLLSLPISRGYLSVDLFFMLSGFVLAHVYGSAFGAEAEWPAIWRFLWARLARIYPVHLATLLLLMPLYGRSFFSGAALLGHLTFTQILLGQSLTWNFMAWSISAEWYSYLLFPVIVARLLTQTRPVFAAGILASCFLPAVYDGSAVVGGPMVLARAVPEFVAGILLYRFFVSGALARFWQSDRTCLICIASIVAMADFRFTEAPIIILFAPLLLCVAHNYRKTSRLLRWGPILFLGRISYSLYMAQGATMFAALELRWHGIVTSAPALALSMAATTFALAVPMSKFVEYPARNFLRRLGRRALAEPASSAAVAS